VICPIQDIYRLSRLTFFVTRHFIQKDWLWPSSELESNELISLKKPVAGSFIGV